MLYFIAAYPMHESEVNALEEETRTRAVAGDIQHGLVTGTADEMTIDRLTARGVVVQALGPVADAARDPGADVDDTARAPTSSVGQRIWFGSQAEAAAFSGQARCIRIWSDGSPARPSNLQSTC